jgi:predicted PurR-regulated permease PerM
MPIFDRKKNSFFNSSTFYFFGISLALIIFVYRVSKRLMSVATSPAFYVGLGVLLLTILCVQNTDVILPFLLAFILAYLGNPLVFRLMRTGLSRVMAVSIVFSFIFVGLGTLIFVSIPTLQARSATRHYKLLCG